MNRRLAKFSLRKRGWTRTRGTAAQVLGGKSPPRGAASSSRRRGFGATDVIVAGTEARPGVGGRSAPLCREGTTRSPSQTWLQASESPDGGRGKK